MTKSSRAVCSVEGCDRISHAKGLCGSHYWRLRKHGDPLFGGDELAPRRPFGLTEEDAFRHFMPGPAPEDDSCWEWSGIRMEDEQYGLLSFDGKMLRAHVVSYRLHGGTLEPGHVVRHTCDNPPCVNPRHLISGTQLDNIDDQVSRGRVRRSPTTGRFEKILEVQ